MSPSSLLLSQTTLHADATAEALQSMFSQHGKVVLVNIPKDKIGNPRGFAFVDMSSESDMESALSNLQEQELGGRPLRITKSLPKDQIERRQTTRAPRVERKKFYVGNLPFEMTADDLAGYFGEHGEVLDVYVPMKEETGQTRGFAFVTMKSEDADKAIESTNNKEFMGRVLTVSLPLPPGEKPKYKQPIAPSTPRTKLYVGNLSFYTLPETLKEIFGEFGNVYDCYMPQERDSGATRGFGFVTMDKEDADKAIVELDGCEVDGRFIEVNEARPKTRRDMEEQEAESNES
jgi:nucleolin